MHAVLVSVKLSDNPDPTVSRAGRAAGKGAFRLRGWLLDPG